MTSLIDKDGLVNSKDFAEELLLNHKMFSNDDAIIRYIESRKVKGWLYEPHDGVLKRQ